METSRQDVILSARNIPRVKTIPVALLNAYDLVRYKYLMVTVGAVRYMEKLWGEK
jgi:large subunit ribosomal protein L4